MLLMFCDFDEDDTPTGGENSESAQGDHSLVYVEFTFGGYDES